MLVSVGKLWFLSPMSCDVLLAPSHSTHAAASLGCLLYVVKTASRA